MSVLLLKLRIIISVLPATNHLLLRFCSGGIYLAKWRAFFPRLHKGRAPKGSGGCGNRCIGKLDFSARMLIIIIMVVVVGESKKELRPFLLLRRRRPHQSSLLVLASIMMLQGAKGNAMPCYFHYPCCPMNLCAASRRYRVAC